MVSTLVMVKLVILFLYQNLPPPLMYVKGAQKRILKLVINSFHHYVYPLYAKCQTHLLIGAKQ